MTVVSSTLNMYTDTDALYRTWINNFSNLLNACGLIKTSDTGQITLPFAGSKPGSTSAVSGYEVFRFADVQQANLPLYLKIEYGLSSSAITGPGFWVTIGQGTDGAGAITNVLMARQQVCRNGTPGTGTFDAGVSYGEGYLAIALGFSIPNNYDQFFFLSRSLDASGTPDDKAIFAFWPQVQNLATWTAQKVPGLQAGRATAAGTGVGFPVLFNPENTNTAELVSLAGDVPLYPLEPFLGKRQPPLLVGCVVHDLDVGSGVIFTATMYGATKKFRRVGWPLYGYARGADRVNATARASMAMRWE